MHVVHKHKHKAVEETDETVAIKGEHLQCVTVAVCSFWKQELILERE